MLPHAQQLWDTYHIPHCTELRGGEIPGVMWERAGWGMQLGPRTILLAHFLLWPRIRGCSEMGYSLAVFNCWSLFQADGSSPVAGRSVAMGWRKRSRKASQGWGGARPLLPAVSHVDMLHSEQCKIPLDLNQIQVSLTSLSQWELGSQCYFQEAFLILPSDSEIRSLTHMTKSVRLDGVLSALSAPHLACEPAQLLPWLPATVHPPQRSTIFICFSSGYGTAGFLWQSQEQWREWLILDSLRRWYG